MKQRSRDVAPLLQAQVLADSIDAQGRMVAAQNSLSIGATQDLDYIGNAVSLAPLRQPRDARQELLRFGRPLGRRVA
jgi:hypothetical protein